jgi:hypothetical protein
MNAWILFSRDEYNAIWDRFEDAFDFSPSIYHSKFPSIKEPIGSITYQFEYPSAENEEKAITDVNLQSLRAFQKLVSRNESIYALDWQHDSYWFYPHLPFNKWEIPVFPDGDYSIFLARDFSFGIFAHPWEQSFCIWGDKLLVELERNKPILFETIIRQNSKI